MNAWRNELLNLVRSLIGDAGTTEIAATCLIATASCAAVMRLSGGAFELKRTEWGRVLLLVLAGSALSIAALIAVRIHAAPHIQNGSLRLAAQIGAVVLPLLALTIPLQTVLHKCNYVQSAISIAVSLIGAAVFTCLVHTAWHSMVHETSSYRKIKKNSTEEKEAVSTLLNP